MEWIFDGIGTAIITFLLGLLVGGGAGYKIAINKNSIKQRQKAGDNSSQTQIGEVNNGR
ncbi:MAG: hypothetical protein LBH36_01630 [Candidatus Nomurabacteria bacterium]|jgi:hypothetical protein|nr:hypothetical protein [Candidatus Nomurabacteria bacterium]